MLLYKTGERDSPVMLLGPSAAPAPDQSSPVRTSSSCSSSRCSSTTESSGMLHHLLLLLGLLSALCLGQPSQDVSAEDLEAEKLDSAADTDLMEALEVLLGPIHSRVSSTEKRGSIPVCGMGDRCAMKFGPRIGKLCDCRRGANCNSYLLKCI